MKTTRNPVHRIAQSMLLGAAILALQSCGGGSSSSSEGSSPFTDPVDAASLRDALVTGSSAGDASTEYWRCSLDDGNTLLGYRLYSDGSGTETDLNNTDTQSSFTWQTTSATTMNTTLIASGTQNNFTAIRFSDQNHVSLFAGDNLSLSCERVTSQPDTPGTPPTATQSLSYGGVNYALTHGFEEVFRYRPVQGNDSHSASEFDVANAAFVQTTLLPIGGSPTQVIWRPNNATVWLRATLHSPGGDGFESATFTFEPESTEDNSPALANTFFFQDGRFGVDDNQDGSIESDDNEFYDITAGTITVTRSTGSVSMSFDVTLENGVPVSGSFSGLFPVFDHSL